MLSAYRSRRLICVQRRGQDQSRNCGSGGRRHPTIQIESPIQYCPISIRNRLSMLESRRLAQQCSTAIVGNSQKGSGRGWICLKEWKPKVQRLLSLRVVMKTRKIEGDREIVPYQHHKTVMSCQSVPYSMRVGDHLINLAQLVLIQPCSFCVYVLCSLFGSDCSHRRACR